MGNDNVLISVAVTLAELKCSQPQQSPNQQMKNGSIALSSLGEYSKTAQHPGSQEQPLNIQISSLQPSRHHFSAPSIGPEDFHQNKRFVQSTTDASSDSFNFSYNLDRHNIATPRPQDTASAASTSRTPQLPQNMDNLDPDLTDTAESDSHSTIDLSIQTERVQNAAPVSENTRGDDMRQEAQYLPSRLKVIDRSQKVFVSTDNLAAANEFTNERFSTSQFHRKIEGSEATTQPKHGRMRIEDDPEIKEKQRLVNRAIGYSNGPPYDKPELMEDWLNKSISYLRVESLQRHSRWAQLEAADRQVKRMRKGIIASIQEETDDTLKFRKEARHRKGTQSANSHPKGTGLQLRQRVAEKSCGLGSGDHLKQTIQHPQAVALASPLPRNAVYKFNGTPGDMGDVPAIAHMREEESHAKNLHSDTNTSKKRKPTDANKTLDSNLGDYWAPQVDVSGGRPKRKPLQYC